MTNEEMLARLQARTGETDTTLLTSYLEDAGAIIINKVYPFRDNITEVPKKYQYRQLEIAVYLVNKRGAEGQEVHIENGIHRHYGGSSIPAEMLKDVMPFAKVPIGGEANEDT